MLFPEMTGLSNSSQRYLCRPWSCPCSLRGASFWGWCCRRES